MATHVFPGLYRRPQFHVRPPVLGLTLTRPRQLATILVALGGIVLDQTAAAISATSVNFIQGSFALTPDEGSWILTVFNATYYTSILTSAWTVSYFGRKRLLISAFLAFAACSALCLFASNFETLVLLRAVQGLALGCVFVPALLSIFVAVRPDDVSKAFLPFAFVSLAASTAGYYLSGVFVEFAEWQDLFAVVCVAGVVLAILVGMTFRTDTTVKRRPLDLVGVALVFICALTFQYLVNEGERRNWFEDPNVVLVTGVLAIGVVALVVWKLHLGRHPFINLRLLKKRPFLLGSACAAMLSIAQYSGVSLVQYAQLPAVQMSPSVSGGLYALRIASFAVAIFGVGAAVMRFRLNVRVVLTVALVLFAVLTFAEANVMTGTADFAAFVPLAFAIGLCQGAANQPLPALVFGSLERSEVPVGAIIYKMAPLLGTSLATAFSQRYLDVQSAQNLSDLAGGVNLASPDIASFVQHGGGGMLASLVQQQASVLAYDDVTRIFACVCIAIIPVLYLIPSRKANG